MGLDEALENFEGDPVEAWHRFNPDLFISRDITQFVLNEYNQAEKTVHVEYGNLIIMSVKLKNGYIVVDHSICMDPAEFDIEKGKELCKEKIINKLLQIYHSVEIKDPENLIRFKAKSK